MIPPVPYIISNRSFLYGDVRLTKNQIAPAFGGVGPESINMFRITGGRIYVLDLWAEVTVLTAGPGVNGEMDITFPAGGLPAPGTFPTCLPSPVDALPPGSFLVIDLDPNKQLLQTGVPGFAVTLGVARRIVEPCLKTFAVDGALTGRMKFGIVWSPLDQGASVAAL